MLKRIITFTLACAIVAIPTSSMANVKRSSLAIAKPSTANNLPTQCQKMFDVANKLILDAEKQPGTHTQVAKMKTKLSSSKQKILAMESEMQQKSCDKGLTALNTLKQKF